MRRGLAESRIKGRTANKSTSFASAGVSSTSKQKTSGSIQNCPSLEQVKRKNSEYRMNEVSERSAQRTVNKLKRTNLCVNLI